MKFMRKKILLLKGCFFMSLTYANTHFVFVDKLTESIELKPNAIHFVIVSSFKNTQRYYCHLNGDIAITNVQVSPSIKPGITITKTDNNNLVIDTVSINSAIYQAKISIQNRKSSSQVVGIYCNKENKPLEVGRAVVHISKIVPKSSTKAAAKDSADGVEKEDVEGIQLKQELLSIEMKINKLIIFDIKDAGTLSTAIQTAEGLRAELDTLLLKSTKFNLIHDKAEQLKKAILALKSSLLVLSHKHSTGIDIPTLAKQEQRQAGSSYMIGIVDTVLKDELDKLDFDSLALLADTVRRVKEDQAKGGVALGTLHIIITKHKEFLQNARDLEGRIQRRNDSQLINRIQDILSTVTERLDKYESRISDLSHIANTTSDSASTGSDSVASESSGSDLSRSASTSSNSSLSISSPMNAHRAASLDSSSSTEAIKEKKEKTPDKKEKHHKSRSSRSSSASPKVSSKHHSSSKKEKKSSSVKSFDVAIVKGLIETADEILKPSSTTISADNIMRLIKEGSTILTRPPYNSNSLSGDDKLLVDKLRNKILALTIKATQLGQG